MKKTSYLLKITALALGVLMDRLPLTAFRDSQYL